MDVGECLGYSDLFAVLALDDRLNGHDVMVLAKNSIRYTSDPDQLKLVIDTASQIVENAGISSIKFIHPCPCLVWI